MLSQTLLKVAKNFFLIVTFLASALFYEPPSTSSNTQVIEVVYEFMRGAKNGKSAATLTN